MKSSNIKFLIIRLIFVVLILIFLNYCAEAQSSRTVRFTPSSGTGVATITLSEDCVSCQSCTFTIVSIGTMTADAVREKVYQAFLLSDGISKGWVIQYVDSATIKFWCRSDTALGPKVNFSLSPGYTGIGWGTPLLHRLPIRAAFSLPASGLGNSGPGLIRVGSEICNKTIYTYPGQTPFDIASQFKIDPNGCFLYVSVYPGMDSLTWYAEIFPSISFDSTLFIQIDDYGLATSSVSSIHMDGTSCADECIILGPSHIPIDYGGVEYFQETVRGGTWALLNITANAYLHIHSDTWAGVSGGPNGGITRLHYLAFDSLENKWKIICSKLIYVDDPLPVELTNFTSLVTGSDLILNWTTASEENNSGFEIQRSSKDQIWSAAGFVKGAGNSAEPNSYTFNDRNLNSGIYNYRLKQIDFNGNFKYYDLSNEVVIGIPDKFSLHQNFPNPFNPVTKIRYDIPVSGNVSMKIYDNIGREVKSIINEFKDAGYYTVEFNGINFASGVYYYKLETGNFTATKKMVLLK